MKNKKGFWSGTELFSSQDYWKIVLFMLSMQETCLESTGLQISNRATHHTQRLWQLFFGEKNSARRLEVVISLLPVLHLWYPQCFSLCYPQYSPGLPFVNTNIHSEHLTPGARCIQPVWPPFKVNVRKTSKRARIANGIIAKYLG